MYSNPFRFFGLSEDCTQAELYDAYISKKRKYEQDRFLEGEEGTNAARMLDECNLAYDEALIILSNKHTINDTGSIFGKVEQLIKNNQLDQAQLELENISARTGQWYYTQAIIFYKKNWLLDSRKQLLLALQLDPNNGQYKETLNRLDEAIRSKNPFTNMGNEHGNNRTYHEPVSTAPRSNSDSCCRTCQALICIDCCCECFGGDFINCC